MNRETFKTGMATNGECDDARGRRAVEEPSLDDQDNDDDNVDVDIVVENDGDDDDGNDNI